MELPLSLQFKHTNHARVKLKFRTEFRSDTLASSVLAQLQIGGLTSRWSVKLLFLWTNSAGKHPGPAICARKIAAIFHSACV